MKNLNINRSIFIKLNEAGIKKFKSYYNNDSFKLRRINNINGYTDMQLKELFNIYGKNAIKDIKTFSDDVKTSLSIDKEILEDWDLRR